MIDLDDRPAWLYELNPVGRVPVLEEDGWVLPESAVINEYLEERYPEPALLPADPAARAAARLLHLPARRLHDGPTTRSGAGSEGADGEFAEALAELDATLARRPVPDGRGVRSRRCRATSRG